MKKIMKTLSLMFAVGAMLFGSGLHHEETKVARAEGAYKKVTADLTDWSGTYLIVYESGTNAYVYNGTDSGANNYVSATISNNTIASSSSVDDVQVIIEKYSTGYSIKVPSGKYISGGNSNGTTFNANPVANSISLISGSTNVKINNNTSTSFQFNSASDQMRFRYFKSTQKAISLYKLEEATSKILSDITLSGTYKTSYKEEEMFDKTGMTVTATYSDESTADVTSKVTITPSGALTTNDSKVTVSYTEGSVTKEKDIKITVTARTLESISVKTNPAKMSYYPGETLDLTGLVLTGTYNDDSPSDIASGWDAIDYTFTDEDYNNGSKTFTITYSGKKTTLTVSVVEAPAVASNLFDFTDTTKSYSAWDAWDDANGGGGITEGDIALTLVKNASTATNPNDSYSNPARFYANHKLIFTGTSIVNRITKIIVTADSSDYAKVWENSTYSVNKSVSISGSVATIEISDSVTTFNVILSAQSRVNSIEVEYEYKKISATLESISVDTEKTKLSYYAHETFKYSDISLNGIYSNGESMVIDNGFTVSLENNYEFTDSDVTDAKTITISYEGVEDTTYTISILENPVTALSWTSRTKSFFEGDLLSADSFEGDKLEITYTSGLKVKIEFNENISFKLGGQEVTYGTALTLEDNGKLLAVVYNGVSSTGTAIEVLERPATEGVQFELVTDASTLKANDRIIIANAEAGQAISTTQDSNNRPGATVTVENNTITSPDFTAIECITLVNGTQDGTFGLKVAEGYLYAASSGSNHMRTETSLSDNSSWSITIADGVATVAAQGTNTRNEMRYNPNNNSPIFSCYASTNTMAKVEIYKYTFSTDLSSLISDVTDADTCTEYTLAKDYRDDYNALSKYEKSIFDSTIVASQSEYEGESDTTTLEVKLGYMEYLNSLNTNSEGLSSNLLSNLTSSNNTIIVLVVGLLGLTSILGYYFLNKKKYSC